MWSRREGDQSSPSASRTLPLPMPPGLKKSGKSSYLRSHNLWAFKIFCSKRNNWQLVNYKNYFTWLYTVYFWRCVWVKIEEGRLFLQTKMEKLNSCLMGFALILIFVIFPHCLLILCYSSYELFSLTIHIIMLQFWPISKYFMLCLIVLPHVDFKCIQTILKVTEDRDLIMLLNEKDYCREINVSN